MILGELITSAVNGISTAIARFRAKSVPQCEIVGDSEGIPQILHDAGLTLLPEKRSRTTETAYIPSWINVADFKE